MRTREPADRFYGERRPLGPGEHVDRKGFARARAGSTTGSNDPRSFGLNPINWNGYEAGSQPDWVASSPYGDTTVVRPAGGMVITKGAQQRVIPKLGVNENIGATDSREAEERPNRQPLGMNTGLRLGSGPRRNEQRGG